MRQATALEVAVGLLQLPSRVPALRSGELPSDLDLLYRIVAGDERALSEATATGDVSKSTVEAAATFYIEQILLHPDADSYRTLGARPDATIDQLRRNMALLMRWLHPDREAGNPRALFAIRVTEAWNNVKTHERRTAYDQTLTVGVIGGAPRVHRDVGSTTSAHSGETPSRAARPNRTFARNSHIGPRRRSHRQGMWSYFKFLIGRQRY